MRRLLHALTFLLVFVLFVSPDFLSPPPVYAQSFGASDVIAAVNNLRKSRGLDPYEVDGSLMSYSQSHSEYQARLGSSTHLHADGTMPSAYGVTENIASGSASFLSLDYVISKIWADSLHMNTMIGYASGYCGAGVALNGGTVYVTFDVRPGKSAAPPPGTSSGSALPAATQIALVPLVTATPNANGAIVHEVGYGQSLWSIAIAYGVKINDIRNLNGLLPDSTDIYAGEKLVIRTAGSVTPQAEGGQTPPANQDSAAQTPVNPPPAASPQISTPAALHTQTPTPTSTATPEPTRKPPITLPPLNGKRTLAIALILIGVVGSAWVLRDGFRNSNH